LVSDSQILVSDSQILVSGSRVLVSDSLFLIRGKFLIRGLFIEKTHQTQILLKFTVTIASSDWTQPT
jgi:hypothetical protein